MDKRQFLEGILRKRPEIVDEILPQALELSTDLFRNTKECHEMAEAAGIGLETFMEQATGFVHEGLGYEGSHFAPLSH